MLSHYIGSFDRRENVRLMSGLALPDLTGWDLLQSWKKSSLRNTFAILGTFEPNIFSVLTRFVFWHNSGNIWLGTFNSEGLFLRNWYNLSNFSLGIVPHNPFLSEELFLGNYSKKCSFRKSSSGNVPGIVQETFFLETIPELMFQELFLRRYSSRTVPRNVLNEIFLTNCGRNYSSGKLSILACWETFSLKVWNIRYTRVNK